MESRNKVTMCRLCLCENECFIYIFEMNDWQGYVAAEVISDLLHCQVSETDVYPHVVCSACLTMLTDFKLFKEYCQKSKETYDKAFISSDCLVMHQPEMPIIKEEELNIDSSGDLSDETFEGIDTQESGHDGSDLELGERDPLEDTSFDETGHDGSDLDPLRDASLDTNVKPFKLEPDDEHIHSTEQVELTLVESVIQHKYLQCLVNKRPHCTSNGEADGDSCSNDDSIYEKSKNISLCEDVEASSTGTMESVDKQRILQGESINKIPIIQQDISIRKEMKKERMEENIVVDGEGWRRTGQEKGVSERTEGLECFHCGAVLLSKHSLIQHMEVHGFVNSYDCDICGKEFHFNSDFIKHGLSHTDSMQFNCAECSKSFSQTSDLKRHIRSKTRSKPYKCAECVKSFSLKSTLKKHVRTHSGSKLYKCTGCSKSFSRNDNLKKHMRTHTGSKPYKCTVCNKCFSKNKYLKKHMRTHLGSKPYKCTVCSKCFSENGYLKIHMRRHAGFKPYKCAECCKSFCQNGDLKKHIRIHTGYKPYKCTECSKCFSQNSSLNIHIRTHTGSKPYKCADCNKCFSRKGHLTVHVRMHTGSKPYKCTVCSKCFSRNEYLKKHMRSHTSC